MLLYLLIILGKLFGVVNHPFDVFWREPVLVILNHDVVLVACALVHTYITMQL